MKEEFSRKESGSFSRFAWFVLAFNVLVITWGAYLRASLSGDGCGQHWLTCGGEVVPTAPQVKTVIEFAHRLSTGLTFFLVLGLVGWAWRRFPANHPARKTAFASFALIIAEALIGAGLVLTGNTAGTWTPSRPFWTIAHLITTFSLLAALALTARFSNRNAAVLHSVNRKTRLLMAAAVAAILLVGMSGSIAALSSMLFPSTSLAEGLASDFAAASNILVRLRISHPILSILTGVYLIFLGGWLSKNAAGPEIKRWSNLLTGCVVLQLAAGTLTFLTLAPIVMQLIHLLLADFLWISFVLLAASVFSAERKNVPEPELIRVWKSGISVATNLD
jgi:heme a synthase